MVLQSVWALWFAKRRTIYKCKTPLGPQPGLNNGEGDVWVYKQVKNVIVIFLAYIAIKYI